MSFIKLLRNKPSGKLILSLTLVLTFVSGLTIGSKASNHTWLSAGNVSYNNGTETTVFDKQDLVYLDERIDSVEQDVDSYKTEIANNVNDWSISQDKQLSSTSSFSDIADTLNYIKSTPDEGSLWVNEGNPVYKRADGSITYDASEAESGSDQLILSAATSDNLSAGKVAWVNGDLVIGTGEDNKAYYSINLLNNATLLKANGLSKFDNTSVSITKKSGLIWGYGFGNITLTSLSTSTSGVTLKKLEEMNPTDYAEGRLFSYYIYFWEAEPYVNSIEISGGIGAPYVAINNVYEFV